MGCKTVDFGKMRHRVELQNFGTTRDEYGGENRTWTTYATVWAAIKYISGNEIDHADQVQGIATHKIMIRYDSRVTVKDRLVFNSRNFEIAAPPQNPGEKKEFLILTCKEVS